MNMSRLGSSDDDDDVNIMLNSGARYNFRQHDSQHNYYDNNDNDNDKNVNNNDTNASSVSEYNINDNCMIYMLD